MKISALDESGNPVDWWFAYKVPQLVHDAKTLNATGYEYVYYDPNVGKVTKSPNLLTDKKGAIDLTLQSVFGKPDDTTGWILYNDEMPKIAARKDSSSFGHTKGVIAFDTDSKTAYWLLHSWPKFADRLAPDMPTPIYGQTYLCISLDLATASQIANQMINHQEPQVYDPRMPSSLDKSDPLYLLTQTLNPNVAGDSNTIDCKSRDGKLAFKVIAKNRKWNKDFWNELVGPTLGADMRTETWIRGKIPPILDSDGIHKTFDVSFIDFRQLGVPWAWPETHDHAKWGITVDSDWVCVGDINRMISQEKRGGGTIAFQEPTLWAALSKTDLQLYPPGFSGYAASKLVKGTQATDHESLADAVARKVKPKKKSQPKSGKKSGKKPAPRKPKKKPARKPARKPAKKPGAKPRKGSKGKRQ
jgi:deoxyribonuclease-2